MNARQQQIKANWMGDYEDLLVAARPELRGKVDWNTATYLFNQNLTAKAAADQYLTNHERTQI